jgi:hypothetical protein
MHIDVDTKPVTPNTYDTKKKRLIETIDRSITAMPRARCRR